MTRQQQFRRRHFVRMRASLASVLAACLATLLLLGLAPPSARPDRPPPPPDESVELIDLAPRIVVPPPPAVVPRPDVAHTEPAPWIDPVADAPETDAPEAEPPGPEPPAPPARSGGFVVFDEPPRARRLAVVRYPDAARAAGIEGWVTCALRIDEQGRVTEVRILDGSSEMFHEAAREAMRASTFRPAMQSGRPVASMVTLRIEFRLE